MILWLKRIGLVLFALVLLLVAGGSAYEAYARHRARSDFPPPGRLVDVGGRRMHVDCRGQGAPTVVFEAGLDTYGSLAWSAVHDKVAAFTRACAYDRAGIMWSDARPAAQDADAVAQDLHATLAAAGEKGPFVLVGHSLGGAYVVDYARRYGDQVAGLVLVDASHPDQNRRMRAAGFGRLTQGPPSAAVLLARLAWTGWTRIAPGDEPMANFPPRAFAASQAYAGASMAAAVGEGRNLDRSLAEAGAVRSLGRRPLVVLTAMQPLPAAQLKSVGMTPADGLRMQAIWKRLQDDEASWSSRSRHQLVPDSTHYIQFLRPDLVVAAVREVVGEARGAPASSPSSKAAPAR